MHAFQPFPIDLLEINTFTKFSKEWALVSSGTKKHANTMTVSWGGTGVVWGKNAAYIFVRDSRYTKELIDKLCDFSEIDECSFVIAGEGYYDFLRNAEAVVNYFIRHRDRKLVVPNPDSVWPNNGRVGFCAGSEARFIANILKEMKIDIDLIYLGKPHTMIFEYARDFMKKKFNLPDLQNSEIVMLGDSLESDIAGAKRFGCQSALVMTGLTTPEILKHTPPEKMPDMIFESIA